ncbi:MAG: hypothetical protein ACLSAH_05645 [Bilophila wadsworthia]
MSSVARLPFQLRYNLLRAGKVEKPKLVLDIRRSPAQCGGVCPSPCMEGCTRGSIDEAVKSDSGAVPLMCPARPPGLPEKVAVSAAV